MLDDLREGSWSVPELQLGDEYLALGDPQVNVDLAEPLERLASGGTFEHSVQAAQHYIAETFLGEDVERAGGPLELPTLLVDHVDDRIEPLAVEYDTLRLFLRSRLN